MVQFITNIIICALFAIVVLKFKVLDTGGTIFAVIMGAIILFTTGIYWFILLLTFLILGAIATKYKRNFKKQRLKEKAARRAMNVVANGLIPTILAIFSFIPNFDFSFPFVVSISVALSDTLASEIGVLSDKAYFITNFKRVEAGTNGAISLLGEIFSLIGASTISIMGYFLLKLTIFQAFLCILLGLLGCHIDSILGATFQGKYKGNIGGADTILTNSDVNLISIAITALIAFVIGRIF